MAKNLSKILCLLTLIFSLAISNEDSKIIEALEAIDNGDAKLALNIYQELYKQTNKKEYLKEMVGLLIQTSKFEEAIKYAKEYQKNDNKDIDINKMIIMSYLNMNKINEAIAEYLILINLENTSENNQYLSSLYLFNKDLNNSRLYAKKAFDIKKNINSLLVIASIDIENDNFNETIPLIKDYYKDEIDEKFALFINTYAIKYKLTPILKELYKEYYNGKQTTQNAMNLARIYVLNNEIDEALKLAKENKLDTNFTIDLYLANKDYTNAKKEVSKAYQKTKDKSYLGLLAIINFESSNDKKSIAPNVISMLKDSIESSPNHIFYNYLGYLLIDYDIDVESGIEYINKALKEEPNNPAYLDSLAWGYYKKNECKKAKEEINKITQPIIEDEIKMHIEAINKCLTK